MNKTKSVFKSFLFAALTILLVCSCSTKKKQPVKKMELRGMIYDYDNLPVSSALLTLTSPEDVKINFTVYSDINGRFDFGEVNAGMYTIEGYKAGYEDILENFTFADARQIVYIKTASLEQLLEKAYNSFENSAYDEAKNYIERAENLDHQNEKALFYEALLYLETQDINEALRILNILEKKDASNVAVLLFLSDIYQYEKKDLLTALKYLKKAHKFSEDDSILQKISNLETLIQQGEENE